MKKFILTLILSISSMISFSQIEYPRIEKDSLGNKVLIMTIEQAQKLDNNTDLITLLGKESSKCDSLNKYYLRVIDQQGKQVSLLELDVRKLNDQLKDKDIQITNLQNQLSNKTKENLLCEQQKANNDTEKDLLKKEIKKQRNQKIIGFITGAVGIIGGVLLVMSIH